MTPVLLDVNVLIALTWPAHAHHEAAHAWLHARRERSWASCPLTQLGFVRVVSNPAFSNDALSPSDAVRLLERMTADKAHTFWPDALTVIEALSPSGRALRGHRQVSDIYLAMLARHHKSRLATFDSGLSVSLNSELQSYVERLPID